MALPVLLARWRADPTIAQNIVDWKYFQAKPARTVPFPGNLVAELVTTLEAKGINSLFIHQAAALDIVESGGNPVVVTGTASGKTLCYNLPVLNRLFLDSDARALYLFPTKALAQDQLAVIRDFAGSSQILPAVYDGDTPANARPSIRRKSRLVFSNPDMLHAGILPLHTAWAEFFQHLEFVVLDEMHIYRGVFGSHVANVVRRLKRVAHFYGAKPQFILTSATIANPTDLAERLVEERVELVSEDGAARGQRHFIVYNPPLLDKDLGVRRSAILESVRLAEDLLTYDIQTILFSRTRRTVELILTYLKDRLDQPDGKAATLPLSSNKGITADQVRGYRSGYLPKERRSIEKGLRNGDLRAVIATNALELGIDIGGMGAAVLTGYPGTIAATWQQAGRAGRATNDALAVLVATANPLDQFLAHHPEYFFERSPEQALINPDNLLILLAHLRCAAFELPFKQGESFGRVLPETLIDYLNYLVEAGVLHPSGSKFFWMADQYPAEGISLRSASADRVVLQANTDIGWTTIGEVDLESATWMVHPQAVYLHEARTYLVEDLDLKQNIAQLRQQEVDYYTQPLQESTVELIELKEQAQVTGGVKHFGDILVTSQVKGFRKIRWMTHEHIGIGELDLPPTELRTTGYWLALADSTVNRLREQGLWSSDPNQYGPQWDRLREQVRARDGYCCQLCGAPEQSRAHDVHHKVPFRTFASPEAANQLSNLITLCPVCHRQVEIAVRVRSGLAGLAYVLSNLAPLFVMCDARDLGVHSDPTSPLAEGKPTVVIYDHIPAGIGLSEKLYEIHSEMIAQAYRLVQACECEDGCPSCVGPGGENGSGSKSETVAILEELAG